MRKFALQRIMSRMLAGAALVQAMPLLLSVVFGEAIWFAYLVPAVLALLLAAGLHRLSRKDTRKKKDRETLRRREGFVAVTLGWMTMVFFTALAYQLTGYFDSFAHSFFESMSGFATVGATTVANIEGLPDSVNFTRAWSHWIGGMGIVVLSVAILPELAVGGMQVFSAEASGFESDKLAPRIRDTARRLWGLYAGMTLVLAILLLFGGMNVLEAVIHSFSTIATGGFSSRNASIASFDSVYIESVLILFMFLSGMSFALLYRVFVQGHVGPLWRSPEVRLYALMTGAVIVLVSLNLWLQGQGQGVGRIVRDSAFTTVSLITTTGFGTADFALWPQFSQMLLVMIMLVGSCAGSTAGGFKMVRLYILVKHAVSEIRRLVSPRRVQTVYLGERPVPRETTEGILGFMLLYFSSLAVGSLIMTSLGMDLVSGATASISSLGAVGPGLGTVGPTAHFGQVPTPGLYALSFLMLLGRLEIYTVLVLFTPRFWHRK